MVTCIHPQCALFQPDRFQAHLVLETLPPFRLILYWTTLVTPQQVSKWENDAKPVGKTSDRVLRLICYTGLIQRLVNDKGGLLVDLADKVALRSEFDIHTLLRSIKHKQKGPKSVTIDPALFNDGGDGEPDRSLVH